MYWKKILTAVAAMAIVAALFYVAKALFREPEFVQRHGGHVYIVDPVGQRWEVSQAESMGFSPCKFSHRVGNDVSVSTDRASLSADAAEVTDDSRVMGVFSGGEARAYLVSSSRPHEVINDAIGGSAVAVVYGALPGQVVVYGRVIKGDRLTLKASGLIYKKISVLVDEESKTLWYPDRKGLRAIQGQHLGQWLPLIDSADTTWGQWRARHPGSLILK